MQGTPEFIEENRDDNYCYYLFNWPTSHICNDSVPTEPHNNPSVPTAESGLIATTMWEGRGSIVAYVRMLRQHFFTEWWHLDKQADSYTTDLTCMYMSDLTVPCCHWSWYSSTTKSISSLLLHCPCRVAILMFLCSLAMAIGIVVYCLVRKIVGQGQTPFCVGCCSGLPECHTVSAHDTCPSSCTPRSTFVVLFLSTFSWTSVHTSGLPILPCLLYNIAELQ